MALIPYVNTETAPADVAELLTALPDLNVFHTIAHAPTLLPPWLQMGGAILSSLDLDPVLRELVIIQAAVTADCQYELTQHRSIAAGVGATPGQISCVATSADERDPSTVAHHFTVGEQAVLRLAETIARTGHAPADQVASVRTSYSDRVLVEIVMVIGYYLATATVLTTLQVDLDTAADMAVVDLAETNRDTR